MRSVPDLAAAGTSTAESVAQVGAGDDDLRACTAFREVSEALAEGRDLDAVLHVIAEKLGQLTSSVRCSIHLKDAESGLFQGRAAYAPTNIDAQVRRLISGGPDDGFTREILRTRRPVALEDTSSDPRPVRAAMRRWNVRSVLGVPMVLREEVVGILCLDDEHTSRTYSAREQALVAAFADLAATAVKQTQLTTQLRVSLATVARQVEQLHQAAQLEEHLTEIVLRGSTLREIGDTVAALLGKPCAIYDASFRRLVLSVAPGGDAEVRPRLLDADIRSIPAVADVLSGLRPGKPEVLEPAPWGGLHHRVLVSVVMLGTHRWGYVAIGEYGRRLGVLDEAVIHRATLSIALERSGERRTAETEWQTVEAFTGALLRGDESPATVERRAEVLGLRLDAPRVVCVVSAREGGELPFDAQQLARFLTGSDSPSAVIGAPSGDDIALILELPEETAPRQGVRWAKDRIRKALAQIGRDVGLFAAVSAVASAAGDDSRAHSECRQVLTCMRNHLTVPGDQVLAADDLGAGRLLLASADTVGAQRFGRDALGPLLGGDGKSRELLVTLAAFLDAGRSVSRAASVLDVHTNTIRYRLGRIAKLTGLDVVLDAEAQLTAQLALLVLRMGGHLPLVGSTSGCDAVPEPNQPAPRRGGEADAE